jgi:hypothetical protein
MVEELHCVNFKSLRDATIPLRPFSVVVGPNASGKTSILQAIKTLSSAATSRPPQPDCSTLRRRSVGESGTLTLSLRGRWDGQDGNIALVWPAPRHPGEFPLGSSTRVSGFWAGRAFTLGPTEPSSELAPLIKTSDLLSLDPSALARPSYSVPEIPSLAADGAGLASVLAEMALSRPNEFRALQEALTAVVPTVRQIRFRRRAVVSRDYRPLGQRDDGVQLYSRSSESPWGTEILFDVSGVEGILAQEASEGTLVVLGVLALLHGTGRPRILLLENIESALHPRALKTFVAQLKAVLAREPTLQIVATSHSPYLIDSCEPEEVLLTAIAPDGSSHCAPLSAHPDFEKWRKDMTAGEFWSTVGEDWVSSIKNA